jgi:hypothetical protein
MNVLLIVAGAIALLATAIHGGAGELLVVRRLSLEQLPRTNFGGPRMTKAMIHVTWHITTVAFLAVGVALILSGTALHGDTRHAMALLAAGASTGFAVVALGLGVGTVRSARSLLNHPGPIALASIAVLAWAGAV